MDRDMIVFLGGFILGAAVAVIVGVSAGLFLTTLMMMVITLLSVLVCFLMHYFEVDEAIVVVVAIFIIITNITMWVTCFIATNPSWAWVGTFFREGILR